MRSARLLILAAVVVAGMSPASAGSRPVAQKVAPGYDLFFTPEGGGQLALSTPVAGVPLMTFRGRPIGTFDFGSHGKHRVGTTDTIVRRLDAATPASPKVRIELVGLRLESTNVPGYYATLQSARPLGLASTGTLEFTFDRSGRGGLLRSELLVNYDIRQGSPTGPIVATGSTGMGFVAEHILWMHSRRADEQPPPPCTVPPNTGDIYCLSADGTQICHESGVINHLHCVEVGRPTLIAGVNHRLNGRDTTNDFHAIGIGPTA